MKGKVTLKLDKESVIKWLARLCIGNYVLLLVYFFFGLGADVLLILSLLVFGTPLFILFILKSFPVKGGIDRQITQEMAEQILADYRARKLQSDETGKPNTDHAYKELSEAFNGGDTQK